MQSNGFGYITKPFQKNLFVQTNEFSAPIPPPISKDSLLMTLDGNLIVSSDGNGMVVSYIDG